MPKHLIGQIITVWIVFIIGLTLFFLGFFLTFKDLSGPPEILMTTGGACILMALLYGVFMFFREVYEKGE